MKALERWLDRTIGEPARKALEQVGHAVMVGAPALLVVHWLPIADVAQATLAGLIALGLGLGREYLQNAGDEPDERTRFSLGSVPINDNMLMDFGAGYAPGAAVASGLAWLL